MLPRPFVPFQLSFDVGPVTSGALWEKINQTVLKLVTPNEYLDFEVRLGAIGVWELTGGSVTLKVNDPINVLTDSTTPDANTLYTVTDFAGRNKWAHVYYKYKPEVHARSIRLDNTATALQVLFTPTTDATAPKLHVQLFGSWRVV
jgi:hypothetical protein